MTEQTQESLLRHVEHDTNGGCWLWSRGLTSDGYGICQHGKRTQLAHRVAAQVFLGERIDGLMVCHRCDVPACINPKHLFVGSQSDNMADMRSKRRANRPLGQRNGRAKLTDDRAREVFDLAHLGCFTKTEIAAAYGVSNSSVGRVASRESFSHVWTGVTA